MDIEQRTAELAGRVPAAELVTRFERGVNRAKRDRQRIGHTKKDGLRIIADALRDVYLAGAYDALSAAMEDFSDDGR